MENIPPPLLLTIPEAAAILKLSRSVTYLLIASGQLRSLKIGRARRVAHADLAAFVERVREGEAPLQFGR